LARHVSTRHDLTSSTCRASRDERVERVEPCCSIDKLDTAKMHRLDTSNVTCRVEAWRAKWNLGLFSDVNMQLIHHQNHHRPFFCLSECIYFCYHFRRIRFSAIRRFDARSTLFREFAERWSSKHSKRKFIGDQTSEQSNDLRTTRVSWVRLLVTLHGCNDLRRIKPKFHLARHVTSRYDSTRSTCRASRDERVERVEPCCFNMADDEKIYIARL